MKKTLLFLLIVAALSVPSFAQSVTVQTYLSSAVTSPTGTAIVVNSASNISASSQTQQTYVYFDGELELVTAVNGTTLTITRNGQNGTRATTHPSGAVVFFGVGGGLGPFVNVSPFPGTACTANQYARLPLVNYANGELSHCRNSRWVKTNVLNPAEPGGVTTTTSGDYTLTLADYILGYTVLNGAGTVTLPTNTAGIRGKVYIIRNLSSIATNTIWVSGNTIDGSALSAVVIGTAGGTQTDGVIRLFSDGSGWFTW